MKNKVSLTCRSHYGNLHFYFSKDSEVTYLAQAHKMLTHRSTVTRKDVEAFNLLGYDVFMTDGREAKQAMLEEAQLILNS